MESENKKIFLWIYYGGLLVGIFLMNYAFLHHSEFTGELMNQFLNLDKFQLVSKEEFFFYVLFIRMKQLVFLFLCYLFFPKYLLLILLEFYLAFCLGGFLSMETYYQGFQGILYGICCFFPHFLCYGMIYYLAWRQAGGRKTQFFASPRKAVFCVAFLGLLGCFLESYVNSAFMITLYGRNG